MPFVLRESFSLVHCFSDFFFFFMPGSFRITTTLPMRPFRIILSYWWEWIIRMPWSTLSQSNDPVLALSPSLGWGFIVRFGHQMFIVWVEMVDGRGRVYSALLLSVPDVRRFGTAHCVFSLAQQGLLSAWAVQSWRCQLSLSPSVFILSSSKSGFSFTKSRQLKAKAIQMCVTFLSKDRVTYRKATLYWHTVDLLLLMTDPFRDP